MLADSLARLIRWVMRDVRYLGAYPARVVSQWPDLSLDVEVLAPKLRGKGIQRLTVRTGIAGANAKVQQGTACLLKFDNGDPRAPAIVAWEYAHNSAVVSLAGDKPLARNGDILEINVDASTVVTGLVWTPDPIVAAAILTGVATLPPLTPFTLTGAIPAGPINARILASQTRLTA